MGFAPCYAACTRRAIRLSHKLQISRLAHPFKVSCLRADYTLLNFNNENHIHYTHMNFDGEPYGAAEKDGNEPSRATRAFRGHRWQWKRNWSPKGSVLVTLSAIKHFLSVCPLITRKRASDGRRRFRERWSCGLFRSIVFAISSVVKSSPDKPRLNLDLQKWGSLKRFTNNWLFFGQRDGRSRDTVE